MPKEILAVQVSGYLFLLGVIIAIIAGLVPGILPAVATILLILGTIIGLLAVSGWAKLTVDEEKIFLLATIGLVVAGASGKVLEGIPMIGPYIYSIIAYIAALVVPAAVLIALHVLWRVGAGKIRLGK